MRRLFLIFVFLNAIFIDTNLYAQYTNLSTTPSSGSYTGSDGTVYTSTLSMSIPIGVLGGSDNGYKYDVYLDDVKILSGQYEDVVNNEVYSCVYGGSDYYRNLITYYQLDVLEQSCNIQSMSVNLSSSTFNDDILYGNMRLKLTPEYMHDALEVRIEYQHFYGPHSSTDIQTYEGTVNTMPTSSTWEDLNYEEVTFTPTETGVVLDEISIGSTVGENFGRSITYKYYDGVNTWVTKHTQSTINTSIIPAYTFTGDDPGNVNAEIEVQVKEYSATGFRQFYCARRSFSTLPIQAPKNVIAKNVGGGNVNLVWDKGTSVANDQLNVTVLRRDNPGSSWSTVYFHNQWQWANSHTSNETGLNVSGNDEYTWTTFTDYTAEQTGTYEYKIYNKLNDDDPTDEDLGFIISNGSGLKSENVGVVTNLTATNNQCEKITLNWSGVNDPSNLSTGESFSVKYNIALESDPYNYLNDEPIEADSFTHVITEETNSTTLNYRVYTVIEREELDNTTKAFEFYDRYSTVAGVYVTQHADITGYTLAQDDETQGVKITWNTLASIPASEIEDGGLSFIFINDQNSSTAQSVNANSADIISENGVSYYIDNANLESCVPYNYKIRTEYCGTTLETEEHSIILTQNTENTFTDTKNLEVSTGYFADRIQLNWDNRNNAIVDKFKIYRRVYVDEDETAFEFVEIGEVSNSTHVFMDEYAEAGVLYQYRVDAVFACITPDGVEEYSFKQSDIKIGFRMPDGAVSGHIEYEGGNSVKDVKVTVEATEETINRSLEFNGINSYVDISSFIPLIYNPDTTKLDLDDSYTFSSWIKPTENDEGVVFAINTPNGNNVTLLYFSQGDFNLYLQEPNNGLTHSYNVLQGDEAAFLLNNWNHVAMSYDDAQDTVRVFVNSEELIAIAHESYMYHEGMAQNNKISIGQEWDESGTLYTSEEFTGYMDEIRIWNSARNQEQIANTYNRYLKKNEEGLIAAYHCDEGLGNWLYDTSKNDNQFNKNNGQHHNMAYSDTVPSATQIGNVGFTDENGNYIIEAIRYAGTGSNFTITPMTVAPYYSAVHEFEPSQRVIFIGDGAIMQDGQNFTDISAFTVSGNVYYHDLHDKDEDGNTSEAGDCPVKDVRILIDGNPVLLDGEMVKTDANGAFTVEMPIGEHSITVIKDGHVFANEGKYRSVFQDEVSGLQFIDSTVCIVRGRAVGGLVEASKPIGFDLSTNNIGQAAINFTSQLGGGCSQASVLTDSESGEYEAVLLPEKYTISFGDGTNTSPISSNPLLDFGAQELLNLKTVALDSVVNPADTNLVVHFHRQLDFIYRSTPILTAKGESELEFIGDEQFLPDTTNSYDLRDHFNTTNSHAFTYPILSKAKYYNMYISASEKYTNFDNDDAVHSFVTLVDSSAVITINNSLAVTPTKEFNLTDSLVQYSFQAGNPEINSPYKKAMNISLEIGSHNVVWDAQPSDDTKESFEGIILGSKAQPGNSFLSEGPKKPDFILRDPPGDGSYSYFEEGLSLSIETSYSAGETSSTTHGGFFSVGPVVSMSVDALFVSIGTESNIVREGGFDITRSSNVTTDNTLTNTYTFNETYQTNSAPGHMTHHDGDLFVGDTKNMIFSKTDVIKLLEQEDWTYSIEPSTGDTTWLNVTGPTISVSGKSYRLGSIENVQLSQANSGTFIYTQEHIMKFLVPNLENTRNTILQTDPRYEVVYTNTGNKEKYGSNNNDATVWGSSASSNDNSDTGPSYIYTEPTEACPESNKKCKRDDVKWMNQQIKIWKDAVKQNEKEKVNAFEDPSAQNVDTYAMSAGVTYTNEKSSVSVVEATTTIEYYYTEAGNWAIGAFVGGVGGQYQGSHYVETTTKASTSVNSEDESTTGFVLYDENVGDSYLINVYPGKGANGPIFQIDGGQSMCPYYPPTTTQVYATGQLPNQTYPVLDGGTWQREVPNIKIDGFDTHAEQFNVPENEVAVFTLSLGNESVSNDDMYYTLKVLESSNPNGAILKVDGLDPNRDYFVPAGTSITKTLTIEKGPEALDYENIKLILHSTCQYDPTDNVADIYDEVLVSAHFLPTCTDIEFVQPDPNWVVNTNHQTEEGTTLMNTILSGYNLNYYSLDKINFEYKPSSSSNWNILKSYHKQVTEDSDEIAIPTDNAYILYEWDMSDLVDGDYDIRALTNCGENQGNAVEIYTDIYSGHVDRLRPHNFGSPSPADGILDPNDEIQLNFNENINEALLGYPNMSISGVLNGSEIRHDAFLYFDGGDQMTIPTGLNLQNKSFTLEMWLNTAGLAAQSLVKQGYADGDQMELALTETGQLSLTISGETVTSTSTVAANTWKHIAVRYDKELNQVDFLIDGNLQNTTDGGIALLADYRGEGPIVVGDAFVGKMHEFRLWKAAKSSGDVYAQMLKTQSGKEANLLGLWPMDELEGTPMDKARARHASTNATWQVAPGGAAYSFSAANEEFLSADVSNLSFRADQDFTIELWFKSSGTMQTLLSNGAIYSAPGENTLFGNDKGWTLQLGDEGKLELLQNQETLATNNSYNDGQWHHVALVKNAKTLTTIYVDGEEQASTSSASFVGFAGSKLVFGATPHSTSMSTNYVNHLEGSLDDIRIWNKARKQNQIVRDARAKLSGNEKGLAAYYPFEYYTLDAFNQYVTTHSMLDQHTDTSVYAALNMVGAGSYNSTDLPLIRMARQIEAVNFSYSSNSDRIILSITDELSKVEGCILDIEVDGVLDMYGNVMSSPITWTAYINQNQLVWDEQEILKEKTLGEPLAFTTNIVNQGGTVESFQIGNLPDWLSASPSEGLLQPNSYEQITFVVNDNLFIGDYTEDITLTGNNNYAERLELNMLVEAEQPSYDLDASDFEHTMNFIAQVKVDDIVSRDDKDILFAYVNDQLRGAASPIYIEDIDKYYLFMDVYSNQNDNSESLEFRLWDASEGKTHAQLSPENFTFVANTVVGEVTAPQMFIASNKLRQEIPLSEGWNWLSFNLDAEDDENASSLLIPTALEQINAAEVATVKGQTSFSQYASTLNQWIGSLQSFEMGDMYMLKMNAADTVVYQGSTLDLNAHPKTINEGWNWIGYLGQRPMGLSEALSSLNPSANDLIKSQDAFSVYFNDNIGWIGSLNALNIGEGYMLKSATAQTLIYPESSLYGGSSFRLDKNQYPEQLWEVRPENYEHSMSIIAQIDHGDYYNAPQENILGAFKGSVCLGNIKATPISNHESLYFLTVYGNEEGLVSFHYYDTAKEKQYHSSSSLSFEANSIVGSIDNPYPIQIDVEAQYLLEENFAINVYPNPFMEEIELAYTLDQRESLSIDVYDLMGRQVKTVLANELTDAGSYELKLNLAKLNQGVYFIEFKVGERSYRKMVVKS